MSEPKRIYVVTSGSYSAYEIIGVFSNKEAAEELARHYSVQDGRVEEYPLDEPNDYPKDKTRYEIVIDQEGNTRVTQASSPDNDDKVYPYGYQLKGMKKGDTMRTKCWAKDKEHAAKIANERRVQLMASGEWESDWEVWRKKQEAKKGK